MHAKWNPTSTATYSPVPVVQVDAEKASQLTIEQLSSVARACPRSVFTVDEKFKSLEVTDPMSCIFCNECKKSAEAADCPTLVRIEPSKRRFVFSVEGTGVIKPARILRSALAILRRKLEELGLEIEKQTRKPSK